MHTFPKKHIFRIFSANDRNQSESKKLLAQQAVHNDVTVSTFSSNAEKMRKIAISDDQIELISNGQNC
jgi:hypothetical protein